MDNKKRVLVMTICFIGGVAQAGEKEDLITLRNTTINLIEELVKKGVLSEKVADEMVKRAQVDAIAEAKNLQQQQKVLQQSATPTEPGEVRVPYVPQFVKDEIRQQVRHELKEEVVGDVMQKAKTEKWGLPEALPEWVHRFKLSGDIRLRSQNDLMSNDNAFQVYQNYQAINAAGGIDKLRPEAAKFLNTTQDRHRFRERVRLAIDAKITDNIQAGVRLATGNQPDPVSTNQSLGNTGAQYDFNLDRAYLKYDGVDADGFKWLTLTGGRIANPWYVGGGEFTGGSELVWDTDLSFEGFVATARYSLGSLSNQPNKYDKSRMVYATAGAFPLQETQLDSHGKWLLGGQVGLDWGFQNQDVLRVALGYYDYINIRAKPNTGDQTCASNTIDNNFSIPQFMQFGNTLASVCNTSPTNGSPSQFGLAADYKIINFNMAYDFATFAPYHVIVGVDYAKNIGFNKSAVNASRNIANNLNNNIVDDETNAWQIRMDFGWPKVDRFGQWNVFAMYKYVERDAVLDAYSDSDFHLGGTNAKGWVLGGNYGLMKHVWFTGRWLSTDVISGPRYGIDTLQLDINAKF